MRSNMGGTAAAVHSSTDASGSSGERGRELGHDGARVAVLGHRVAAALGARTEAPNRSTWPPASLK